MSEDNEYTEGNSSSKRGLPAMLDAVLEAMEFESTEADTFLNVKTGQLVRVTHEAYGAIERGENTDPLTGVPLDDVREMLNSKNEDYLRTPDRFEINEYGMMCDFAESLEDESASGSLFIALEGQGAFRRFKDMVHHLGLAERWYKYRDEAYKETAKEWLEEHGIEYER